MAKQPMYHQIAEDLHRQIDSGTLERGSQLPTEEKLGVRYDASRNTIRDAIKRLIAMGLVETRPGQGTFVTRHVDPFVTTLSADPASGGSGDEGAAYLSQVSEGHRTAFTTSPKVEVQEPSATVARRLRIGPGSQVISRHEERYIDKTPWSLRTSYYPMEFIVQGATRLLNAADISEGAVRYLGDSLGITQVGYRDWITARPPDEVEQRFFGISHDLSVFVLFRTAFDQNHKPMRVTVTVYPTDRNQFIVDVGEVPDPKYDEEPGETA